MDLRLISDGQTTFGLRSEGSELVTACAMLLSASVYFSLFLQRISKTELSQLARPTNSVDAVVRIVSLPSDMTVHCVASKNIDPEVTMRSA